MVRPLALMFLASSLLWPGTLGAQQDLREEPISREGPAARFVPTPESQVYLQMGAFRTPSQARVLVRALEKRGHVPRVRQEGSVYRVFLQVPGSEAEALCRRLEEEGWRGYLQLAREPEGREYKLTTD